MQHYMENQKYIDDVFLQFLLIVSNWR